MGVGEALIRYTDVEIHQQELCVLNDVNLELHKGEFVYLVGKVGSGGEYQADEQAGVARLW